MLDDAAVARETGLGYNPATEAKGFTAEQVKAVGKTYHKWCLRCRGCEKTLDTGRLVDKDGEPFCQKCYGKVRVLSPPSYLAISARPTCECAVGCE